MNEPIIEIEQIKVKRFSDQMTIELWHNEHKGSVLDWHNFDNMITELEYHKAKMLLAIRVDNRNALKEYIADTANILLAIGNRFGLYDDDTQDLGVAFELNKEWDTIKCVSIDNQSLNQKLT